MAGRSYSPDGLSHRGRWLCDDIELAIVRNSPMTDIAPSAFKYIDILFYLEIAIFSVDVLSRSLCL